MNQDQVKEKLLRLYDCTVDFTVIFSGKKSKKVNGLYKPDTKEIIIHNKNFVDDNGGQIESLLMFTAIHELAHHILMSKKGQKSARAHSQTFWAIFHDLIDKAETAGIYQPEIDADTQKLIDEARAISRQIADLQRKLGGILIRINDVCKEKGLRYEDVVERKAQIAKQTANISVSAFQIQTSNEDIENVGADIQAEAAKQRDAEKRNAILAAGVEGKSVIQAKKATTAPARAPDGEDETVTLIKEKRRIEHTIESLTRRLEELNEQLEERGEI